ncbi:hypothetical protein ALP66_102545, partial [Pseudomonas amygdali pv. photiniae]
GLWRFMQRGIGARGAGGACGPIAFDRPLRRFGIGSALDVDILQLYGRLPGSNLVSPGGLRDRLNDAKWNESTTHRRAALGKKPGLLGPGRIFRE